MCIIQQTFADACSVLQAIARACVGSTIPKLHVLYVKSLFDVLRAGPKQDSVETATTTCFTLAALSKFAFALNEPLDFQDGLHHAVLLLCKAYPASKRIHSFGTNVLFKVAEAVCALVSSVSSTARLVLLRSYGEVAIKATTRALVAVTSTPGKPSTLAIICSALAKLLEACDAQLKTKVTAWCVAAGGIKALDLVLVSYSNTTIHRTYIPEEHQQNECVQAAQHIKALFAFEQPEQSAQQQAK